MGPVEIFLAIVVLALVAYVLWRLLVRPTPLGASRRRCSVRACNFLTWAGDAGFANGVLGTVLVGACKEARSLQR
jgi:hypothetical protein